MKLWAFRPVSGRHFRTISVTIRTPRFEDFDSANAYIRDLSPEQLVAELIERNGGQLAQLKANASRARSSETYLIAAVKNMAERWLTGWRADFELFPELESQIDKKCAECREKLEGKIAKNV